MSALIELPFPPSSLSGHNNGHWRSKSNIVAKHRKWAAMATIAANACAPEAGDIRISITFYPPNKRGDRVNFANRMKPYLDGIADALKVNDSRFLPSYHFAEPVKEGRVVIEISKQGELEHLFRILGHIEDASARKSVIMAKWERGEITSSQAEQLIQSLGLQAA